ncbi:MULTISPECIES: DUF2975 domain-containing protein [unclassified Pseudodesulfovibrio]|uniref:DUF2975 domain-containing protein n=1 Tax=unclassified Pseudodesulfovibrio TaxID=2661612 RepID=UPI000FEBC7FF|nr:MULTISPECIES: DUF2975 domain-containing protein [unclassified Pseudodesulfovibrio]MCJ2164577.1 DUF2975 domain-containing protein [Pseudodesulfovibrio sp. S3-i]RWU04227.1 DUF2975 domain-containing protein [Pseudodesulfovibrio sp. S3]
MKNRIQSLSRVIRSILVVVLIASPLIVGLIWLSGGEILMGDAQSGMTFQFLGDDLLTDGELALTVPLPWEARILGLSVTMIPVGIGMIATWWLICLFGCFARGEVFTQSSVSYISRTGWTMVASVVTLPIYQLLLSWVLTMHNQPGERLLSISLDLNDLEKIITAAIIILVSWIMEEGRKLRENDDLTV